MRINLHVERLVLEGPALTPPEQRLLQAAVTEELERLLQEGGLASPAGDLAIRRLPVAQLPLGTPADPVALGEAIARSLYGGLAR